MVKMVQDLGWLSCPFRPFPVSRFAPFCRFRRSTVSRIVTFNFEGRAKVPQDPREIGIILASQMAKQFADIQGLRPAPAGRGGISWKLVGHHRKVTLNIAWL